MSEEIWYPKFGLESDPFGIYDYTIEEERYEGYPRIKTLAVKKIFELAKSGTNVILAGPKGAGKTTAMAKAKEELKEECLGMVGFRTITDIYNYLWLQIWNNEKDTIKRRFGQGKLADMFLWFRGERCRYPLCPRKKLRAPCKWTGSRGQESSDTYYDKKLRKEVHDTERKFEDICTELYVKQDTCPMKRFIVNELLSSRLEFFRNKIYLLDIHDEFLTCVKRRDEYVIEKLLTILQRLGNVIVTATEDQYRRLKVSESIARIRRVNFPLPTSHELKEICVQRTRAFQQTKSEPLPFGDEAVQALIIYSHNIPRHFIQKCGDVLFAMWEEKRNEPADKDFVMKTLGFKTGMNETDAIDLVLSKLRVDGRVWVKVKEVKEILESPEFGQVISDKRLGRRLKHDWKLVGRYNPDAEYKLR